MALARRSIEWVHDAQCPRLVAANAFPQYHTGKRQTIAVIAGSRGWFGQPVPLSRGCHTSRLASTGLG